MHKVFSLDQEKKNDIKFLIVLVMNLVWLQKGILYDREDIMNIVTLVSRSILSIAYLTTITLHCNRQLETMEPSNHNTLLTLNNSVRSYIIQSVWLFTIVFLVGFYEGVQRFPYNSLIYHTLPFILLIFTLDNIIQIYKKYKETEKILKEEKHDTF